MKRIDILFLAAIFVHFPPAVAAEYQLTPVSQMEFQQVIPTVKHAMNAEILKEEIAPFDMSQTFALFDSGEKIGYFVPAKFNSKIYKNTICRLYFVSLDRRLAQANLFAEKNDEDDVVPSCIGVEAVSSQTANSSKLLYLAIIRNRTVNNYSSDGAVISYKNGQLDDESSLNRCIKNAGPMSTIISLRKQLRICLKETRR